MDIEKDWFKYALAVGAIAWGLWMRFFNKNDEVLKIILKNQQDHISRVEKEAKEDQDEAKAERKQNAEDIKTLSELMTATCTKFDTMSEEYRKERKVQQKANDLKDDEINVWKAKAESAVEMSEYQKKEFKAHMSALVKVSEDAFKVLGIHDKITSKSKTG